MTRVLVAAPTPTVRAGLRALLTAAEIQVVGETAVLSGLAATLSEVDVILVADQSILHDARPVLEGDERVAVVVLSGDAQIAQVLRGLPLTGWGIVSPDATATELQSAVAAAGQGFVVLSPALIDRLASHRTADAVLEDFPAEPLTIREREVLALLGQGLPNKLIARSLGISEHTVKFHVSSIFTKLGVSSRTEAVGKGARQGLISL